MAQDTSQSSGGQDSTAGTTARQKASPQLKKSPLVALRQEQALLQEQQDVKGKVLAKLTADLTSQQKANDDINKLLDQYKQAHEGYADAENDFQSYYVTELAIAKAGIQPPLTEDKLKSAIADVQAVIKDIKDQMDSNTADLPGKDKAYNDAIAATAIAQANLDKLKGTPKAYDDQLKQMKALKDAADKAEQQKDTSSLYVNVYDLNTALQNWSLLDSATLSSQLNGALKALKDAQDQQRIALEQNETAKADATRLAKEYTALTASRATDILAAINDASAP